MRDDQQRFLNLLGQLPARLTAEQTAWVLNCQPHDVPVLVAARLLKPLGTPQPNRVKYFAAVDVLELTKDRSWLAKMTNAVSRTGGRRTKTKPPGRGWRSVSRWSLVCRPEDQSIQAV